MKREDRLRREPYECTVRARLAERSRVLNPNSDDELFTRGLTIDSGV